jgi:hypothetical protein
MTMWMVVGSAGYAFLAGREWDESVRRLEEQLEREDLEEFDRINTTQTLMFFQATRGEAGMDRARALLAAAGISDSQLSAGNEMLLGEVALTLGEFESAVDAVLRGLDIEPGFTWIGALRGGIGALWARDSGRVRALAERLDAAHMTGRMPAAVRVGLRAALASLEGRPADAFVEFRDALRRFRDLGQFLGLADTSLAFALAVGPADPEARAAGEEAREIFAGLGARPWVERADAVLSGEMRPILEPGPVAEAARAP